MGTGQREPARDSNCRRNRPLNKSLLKLPAWQTGPFNYVHCGARDDVANALVDSLPDARFVGFEPDLAEYNRLCQQARDGYIYFPVAVGHTAETRVLHLTKNPACSSLLVPNYAFWSRFIDCAPQIEIIETRQVQTVALDSYLPTVGIHHIDFLELDTQGTELEVLRGAEIFLSSSILGIKVEVEFSPMYLDQPLFSDVDAYLRQFGFVLFDLLRHRYRGQNYSRDLDTRGQLLYGDAFYLKDYQPLAKKANKQAMTKLAIIAAFHDFHDYALEIVDSLLQGGAVSLTPEERAALTRARVEYMSSLGKQPWWVSLILKLEHSRLRWLFHLITVTGRKAKEAYRCIAIRRSYNWSD